MKTLKIGDVVYIVKNGNISSRVEIEKVTKTMAKSTAHFFDLKIDKDGHVRMKGVGPWDTSVAYVRNKELDEKFKAMLMRRWFERREFTNKEVEMIYRLINKK